MVLGSSENSTQCSREKAPGACYIGAAFAGASIPGSEGLWKIPSLRMFTKVVVQMSHHVPRAQEGSWGLQGSPGCWAIAAISSDILDPTKRPDEKEWWLTNLGQGNFKIMNESSSAFTSALTQNRFFLRAKEWL